MIPLALLKLGSLVAAMRIFVAVLPNGDIERTTFSESQDGVRVVTEHSTAGTDVKTYRQQFLKPGRYTWKIEEDRRSVLMTLPGRPTGVVRRTFTVAAWLDTSRFATDAPRPVEVFRFYAPTRDQAVELQNRLRRALRP